MSHSIPSHWTQVAWSRVGTVDIDTVEHTAVELSRVESLSISMAGACPGVGTVELSRVESLSISMAGECPDLISLCCKIPSTELQLLAEVKSIGSLVFDGNIISEYALLWSSEFAVFCS